MASRRRKAFLIAMYDLYEANMSFQLSFFYDSGVVGLSPTQFFGGSVGFFRFMFLSCMAYV
jgi:hypothetical protein